MCGLTVSLPELAVAKKFLLSAASNTACDQNAFGMCGAAAMAVRAAAISCRNPLSAKALDCDAFGAVCIADVPLLSRNSLSFFESCYFDPSVCNRFVFMSQIL